MYLIGADFPYGPTPVAFAIPKIVGIPTEQFNLVATAQETPNLCWAACTQSILTFFGIPLSQQAIVARIHGVPVDVPASDSEISASLNGRAVTNDGRATITVRSRLATGAPNPTELIRALGQLRPVLLKLTTGFHVAHAVVATSVTYVDAPWGPQITSLTYRDPYPTFENWINKGKVIVVEPQLSQLWSTVVAHWLIEVRVQRRGTLWQ